MARERHPIMALVPLASPARAKSRLAGVLSPAERAELATTLADRVLAALRAARVVDEIAIVGPPDAFQVSWAARGIAHVQAETGDLNADLDLGRRWAMSRGAWLLLVAHADLAFLDAATVRKLVSLACIPAHGIVIAGNADLSGTNALALRPPDAIPFAFGLNSFQAHRRLADERHIGHVTFATSATSFDVDWPADLARLERRGIWSPARLREAAEESA